MPFPEPTALYQIQRNMVDRGACLMDIHPHFNEYKGASIHAHRSNLLVYEKIRSDYPPKESLSYTPFYTGDVRQPGGLYECTACGTRYDIGPDSEYNTIYNLKQAGCNECSNDTFRRVGSPGSQEKIPEE